MMSSVSYYPRAGNLYLKKHLQTNSNAHITDGVVASTSPLAKVDVGCAIGFAVLIRIRRMAGTWVSSPFTSGFIFIQNLFSLYGSNITPCVVRQANKENSMSWLSRLVYLEAFRAGGKSK